MRVSVSFVIAALAGASFTYASQAASPGKLPEFLELQQKLSSSGASKSSSYKSDLKRLQTLGKELKEEGASFSKVLGDDVLGKKLMSFIENNDDIEKIGDVVASLTGTVNAAVEPLLESRSDVEDVGTLPKFLSLLEKLEHVDAKDRKKSDFDLDFKNFATLGQSLSRDGANLGKLIGDLKPNTAVAQIMSEIQNGALNNLDNLVGRDLVDLHLSDLQKSISSLQTLGSELSTELKEVTAPNFLKTLQKVLKEEAESDASDEMEKDIEADFVELKKLGEKLQKSGVDLVQVLGTEPKAQAIAEMFDTAEHGIQSGVKSAKKAAQHLTGRRAMERRRRSSGIERL